MIPDSTGIRGNTATMMVVDDPTVSYVTGDTIAVVVVEGSTTFTVANVTRAVARMKFAQDRTGEETAEKIYRVPVLPDVGAMIARCLSNDFRDDHQPVQLRPRRDWEQRQRPKHRRRRR